MSPANEAPRVDLEPADVQQIRWGEVIIESIIKIAGISAIVIIALIFFFLFASFPSDSFVALRLEFEFWSTNSW